MFLVNHIGFSRTRSVQESSNRPRTQSIPHGVDKAQSLGEGEPLRGETPCVASSCGRGRSRSL